MLHKMGTFNGRKVSPPTPTMMTDEQKSTYLSNLRNTRPARPAGSRPPPFKSGSQRPPTQERSATVSDTISNPKSSEEVLSDGSLNEIKPIQSRISKSDSFSSMIGNKGRPLVQDPGSGAPSVRGRKVSPTAVVQRNSIGPEEFSLTSASRLLEKEEAHTLRKALEIIDQRDEEKKVYAAAQFEAADLVWKHRYPKAAEDEKIAPYRNPDLENRKLQKSHPARTTGEGSRSVSNGSITSPGSRSGVGRTESKRKSWIKDKRLSDALNDLQLASQERAAQIISVAKSSRTVSGGRQVSSGSMKGLFRNPDDQIYEEPEVKQGNQDHTTKNTTELPLQSRTRNPFLRGSRPLPGKPNPITDSQTPKIDRLDIYNNPPSQSRNAAYTSNPATPIPRVEVIEEVDTPKSASSLEIRSDEIRAATSMKRKDRSPKLPTPTIVSDQPGRPIVSFDPSWKPPTESPRSSQDFECLTRKSEEPSSQIPSSGRPLPRPLSSRPETTASAPVIPTINLPGDDEIPSINIVDEAVPSISVSAPDVPAINVSSDIVPNSRPLPQHSASAPSKVPSANAKKNRLPWFQSGPPGMPTVTCSSCALPIAGRVVTASGSNTLSLKARLHPECFTCFHCSTPLECVSFYPEPDNKRAERLESEGLSPDSEEADLRFYCHLDFHEFFSPRCRSCKTPIEGEIIVAAGGEWHVGHFFCGECGDPFDSSTPFVEKDGYAYCVSCHTKRTSARCKECKKQILDELTVEALGGKWHEQCFVCYECGDGFGDDGRFFIRDIEVEPTDKERRKGINRKREEKAVCLACEERRLKA